MTQADTTAQGGLEQVAGPDRVTSLTGIRAVAALLVVATHAAYTTGKYIEGYFGLFCSRMEMGVPIFFVLSGFLLFRPWVKSAVTGGPEPSIRRYAWHLGRVVPAPDVDADLHLQLHAGISASGSDPDVEPGGGSLLLRHSSAAGLP